MKRSILQQHHLVVPQQNDLVILEQHHKNGDLVFQDPHYHSIMLNSCKIPNTSYEFSDSTFDNISERNLTYVDLTGVYWLWKNVHTLYKGNVHYSRYFTDLDDSILTSDKILSHLRSHDAIVPAFARLEGRTVYQIFSDFHGPENMDSCREIISKICPDYLSTFDDVIMTGEYSSLYNMLIASSIIFDAYCDWLFSILFPLETHLKSLGRLNFTEDDFQRKVFGFIGERLLLVWLTYNKIDYIEIPVHHFDHDLKIDF